ncbi:hypothetical protein M0811_14414 [Anaeramoeba ignava]|uniref:Uncharacterized protein n=1 Tax=Anaeramoeba ignava TaxID=1746090 RepID=A0A9Q0LXA8_ANAIG|nr:hypothetical protein M0811_14414 [Anaeramoeba ignava]
MDMPFSKELIDSIYFFIVHEKPKIQWYLTHNAFYQNHNQNHNQRITNQNHKILMDYQISKKNNLYLI